MALDIAVIVTALSTDAYLTRRALRLVGLRSRAIYLAMGTGLVALTVGCFTAVARLDAHNNPSLADAFGFIGLLASWAALLALGRALTWGRLRRLCWVYPPAGRPDLAHESGIRDRLSPLTCNFPVSGEGRCRLRPRRWAACRMPSIMLTGSCFRFRGG